MYFMPLILTLTPNTFNSLSYNQLNDVIEVYENTLRLEKPV